MFSIGRIPYVGENAKEIVEKLKAGFRLQPPNEIDEVHLLRKIYGEVTKWCWKLDPKLRWSFSDLVEYFETYFTTEEKEEYKRLEKSYKEMHNLVNDEFKMSSKRKISTDSQASESTKLITSKVNEQEAVYHKFKGTLNNDIEIGILSVVNYQSEKPLNSNEDYEVMAESEINMKLLSKDEGFDLENDYIEQVGSMYINPVANERGYITIPEIMNLK